MSKRFFFILLVLAILIVLPWVVGSGNWLRLLDNMLLYMMLAIGLNFLLGYTGLLNFGYLAFYGLGAYTYALLSSPHFGIVLPSLLVFMLIVLISFLVGCCVAIPAIRLKGDYLAIVTIGFAEIFYIVANNMDRPFNLTNGAQGITGIVPIHWHTFYFDQGVSVGPWHMSALCLYYYFFLVMVVAVSAASYFLERFAWGRVFRAIRDDELASMAMGIPIRFYKVMIFAISAMIAGIAGGCFASFQGFISPVSFSLKESFLVFIMVIFGGMGNIFGVLLGTALLVMLPEIFRSLLLVLSAYPFMHGLPQVIQNILTPEVFRQILFSVIIFIFIVLRPMGLLPAQGSVLGRNQLG